MCPCLTFRTPHNLKKYVFAYKNKLFTVLFFLFIILFVGFAGASDISAELPAPPYPAGEVTTVPVIMTNVANLSVFTIDVATRAEDFAVAINTSQTNSLRRGSYINNAYADDTARILWYGMQPISGENVILFYLDITPSKEITSDISIPIHPVEIVMNNVVSIDTADPVLPADKKETASATATVRPTVSATKTIAPATPATPATPAATSPESTGSSAVSETEQLLLSGTGAGAPPTATQSPAGFISLLAGLLIACTAACRREKP